MHKIIVFDERIDSYDERIFQIKPIKSLCFYCKKIKEIRYKILNIVFLVPLQICDDCASMYYGGVIPLGGTEPIPHDPLLDYLEKIDPNPILRKGDLK